MCQGSLLSHGVERPEVAFQAGVKLRIWLQVLWSFCRSCDGSVLVSRPSPGLGPWICCPIWPWFR